MIAGEQAMARVVGVLDDLFGLPVTSGAVGVLEGRQCDPVMRWADCPAVGGSAVAVPGGDTA